MNLGLCATGALSTCTECKDGYGIAGSTTCVICTAASCKTCAAAAATCSACNVDKYLASPDCTTCAVSTIDINCAECSANTACTKCKSGY